MVAIYYCKKKLKIDQPTKKHIDLLYIYDKAKIYNKQLAKMWKRKLTFFPSYLLDPINRVNKLIPGWKIHTIEILSDGSASWECLFGETHVRNANNSIEKYQSLDFTPDEEMHGKEMLKKFGLNDNDKFVCFAVRDAAYSFRKISSRFADWSYHNCRNYDIDDFVMAAESLAEKGYYVFRMGVVVEKPLNSNNPRIIDYANSELRSDFMDLYLAANCSFCVSTGEGFCEALYLFRKPMALLFLPVGDFISYSDKVLLMTKSHVLKKEKKQLSLSEIFSHGVAFAYDSKIFKEKGIELINYTPEDIKDFVIEMSENLEFKKKPSSKDEELQKTFKNLYGSNFKRFSYQIKFKNVLHGKIRSRLSMKFIEKNKNWLN